MYKVAVRKLKCENFMLIYFIKNENKIYINILWELLCSYYYKNMNIKNL